MKVYNILATIVVEDKIDDSVIAQICRENIELAIKEDFNIGNCITHYDLKETINHPDISIIDTVSDEVYENEYDGWIMKSQEVIDRIKMEMRNP